MLLTLLPRAPVLGATAAVFRRHGHGASPPPMGWILSSVSLSQRRFVGHCPALSARLRHILILNTLCVDKVLRCHRTVAEIEKPVT
jgi:hypothetical protein